MVEEPVFLALQMDKGLDTEGPSNLLMIPTMVDTLPDGYAQLAFSCSCALQISLQHSHCASTPFLRFFSRGQPFSSALPLQLQSCCVLMCSLSTAFKRYRSSGTLRYSCWNKFV
jgi:hypothetical protein